MEQTDVNIGSLCRLCGSKTQSGDRVEIFTSDDLSHQIRSLLGLDLSESDLLPTFVCAECAAKLADFNEFKASSHRTDLMFRDLLGNARDASHVDCPGLSDNVAMDSVLTIDEFKFEDEPEIDVSNYSSEPVISANIEQFLKSDPLALELDSISESTSEVLSDITKVQSSSTDPTVQPCKSYTEVQFQTSPEVTSNGSYSEVQVLRPLSSPKICSNNKEQANNLKNKTRNTHKCTYCNKVLKFACDLKKHIQIHNKEYDHFCQYCNKGFVSNSQMQIHIRAAHTKEYLFMCNICGQKFVTQYTLRSHIETYHINSKNYHCKICNKSFKLAKHLRIHARRKHLGVDVPTAFSCDVCGQVFDDKTNLVKHFSMYHQAVKEPEETVYPWSLVQRSQKAPSSSVQGKESQVSSVEVQLSVECTISSQESKKIVSPSLIQDNTAQAASVQAMPIVKSSQKSRIKAETVKNDSNIDDDFVDTFKGKIFIGKTYSNPRKVKALGTINLQPTESSKNTEIDNRSVSEMVSGQMSLENGNISVENKTESTKQRENSDFKVKRSIVNIIACPYCHLVFRHFNELNLHIRKAHKLHCNYCYKIFRRDLDLQDHIKAEHTKVVVDVKECDNASVMPSKLQEHKANKELSEKKYFQCQLCPKSFNSLRNLRFHHRRLHNENRKKYNCELCKDKVFLSKDSLRHHVKVIHLGTLYNCELCDKTFTTLASITGHRESKHFNLKKHVCKICNTTFAFRSYLSLHLKTHDNQRPFQCTKCLKAFKRSSTLKSHLLKNKNCGNLKKYDNTRPFQCTKCLKTFKDSRSLKLHFVRNKNCISISEIL